MVEYPKTQSVRTIIAQYERSSKVSYIPKTRDYSTIYYNLLQWVMDIPFFIMVIYVILFFTWKIVSYIVS